MPVYTAEPRRFDHKHRIGDTLQPAEATLYDGDGVALSMDGVTGECAIRREPGGAVLAEPAVACAGTSFTWRAEVEELLEVSEPGRYVYGVRLTWPDGTVRTVLIGDITAEASTI